MTLLRPDKRDIDYLSTYMKRESMGNIRLSVIERNVWKVADYCEIVALDAKQPEDYLTKWITGFFTDIYHWLIGQHTGTVVTGQPDKRELKLIILHRIHTVQPSKALDFTRTIASPESYLSQRSASLPCSRSPQ